MSEHKYIYFSAAHTFEYLASEMDRTGKEPFKGFRKSVTDYRAKVKAAHAIIDSGNYPNANPNADTPQERKRKDCISRGYAELRKVEETRKDLVAPYRGKRHAGLHYLVGYCPQTITYYRKMADELRKDFPEAKDEDIECRQVLKSNCVQGFTLITWSTMLVLPAGERDGQLKYPGWRVVEGGCDYGY